MAFTFSVITPSYNQGLFIERTILSVLNQADVNLEYIVCDGGSCDTTLEVLTRYQDRLSWISGPDGGQAEAVNTGIQRTTGDIIAWINSDDIYYPQALSRVQHIFETYPEVQVVYGNAYHIDQEDQIIEAYPTMEWSYQNLKDVCFLCQPATFFRRSVVENYGLLNPQLKFCMDYELWLRYGKHTDFFYLPEFLAGSRLYQDNKTLGQRVGVHYEINEMMLQALGLSPEKWVLAYASVLVDDRDSREGRDTSSLAIQMQRMNEFLVESFRGYGRWRKFLISPITILKHMRWIVAVYYRWFKGQVSSKLHL